jgi:hypothetical protein
VTTFCYPAGLFGARERGLVAEAGFRLATSCEPGVNTPDTDPLALRRLQVVRRDRMLTSARRSEAATAAPGRLRAVYRRRRSGTAAG